MQTAPAEVPLCQVGADWPLTQVEEVRAFLLRVDRSLGRLCGYQVNQNQRDPLLPQWISEPELWEAVYGQELVENWDAKGEGI